MVHIRTFLIFPLLFSTPDFGDGKRIRHELSNAEQISLEFSNRLLPPKTLSKTIDKHLKLIKEEYPLLKDFHHLPKWVPGELLLYSEADTQQMKTKKDILIHRINGSKYGPVELDDRVDYILFLHFPKPYNPTKLAAKLRSRFQIEETILLEPDHYFGDGMDVTYHRNDSTHIYTFKKGWGDCPSGCMNRHYWEFGVSRCKANPEVKLLKEWGDPLTNGGSGEYKHDYDNDDIQSSI